MSLNNSNIKVVLIKKTNSSLPKVNNSSLPKVRLEALPKVRLEALPNNSHSDIPEDQIPPLKGVDSDFELHSSDVNKGQKLKTRSDVESSPKNKIHQGGKSKKTKNVISSENKTELSMKSSEQSGASPIPTTSEVIIETVKNVGKKIKDTVTDTITSITNSFTTTEEETTEKETEVSTNEKETTEAPSTTEKETTEVPTTTDIQITETETTTIENKKGGNKKKVNKKGGNNKTDIISDYSSVVDY